MLRLKALKFKGIGRFVEEQTIHFDVLGKLVQLGGKNNNTQGSSGAGKSTVFMALDYLFGVSNKPSTILKSRYSDEGITVEGVFEWDDKPLVISRGKKLSIVIDNGEPVKGSSSITEEKLDGIIGMDRQLFRKMLHKRQKEGGFFLEMTPAQINAFLSSALGHEKTNAKIEIVDKELKKLTEKKISVASALASSKAALKATQDAILSMGLPPVREVHQSLVLELKNKSESSMATLTQVISVLRLEEEALNAARPRVTSVPFDRSTIEALEKEYDRLQIAIRARQDAEKDRLNKARITAQQNQNKCAEIKRTIKLGEEASKKAVEVAEQLKKIRLGKCYTCGHDWVDQQNEANLIKSVKVLREQITLGLSSGPSLLAVEAEIVKDFDACVPLEVNVNDLMGPLHDSGIKLVAERQKEKDHQTEQTKSSKLLLDAHATKEASMRAAHRQTLDQSRGQADIDRRTYEAALSKLRAYEEARTRYEASQTSLKAQETSYGEKVTQLTVDSTVNATQNEMAEELKRGLKSYLSCSFDEALETISENATKLIRNIPNMANATIQLEGTKETQDGKVKEEVTAVIHMDGEENIDIRSLCGGERTALDLAIDLSVIDMLESKANKGIDIFILDEPFDGLDTVCILSALEVLKNSNSNKRLVLVDHNPEVQAMVESQLVVVRDGTTSRILQTA